MPAAKILSWDNVRIYPIKSGVSLQRGDICYRDSLDGFTAKPAASIPWNSTLAQTQADFAIRCVGVVLASYTGSTFTGEGPNEYGLQRGEVAVAQEAVVEYDCNAGLYQPSVLVAPAKQTGNALESQKVAVVTAENSAIGRVHRQTAAGATRVQVSISPNLATVTGATDTGS